MNAVLATGVELDELLETDVVTVEEKKLILFNDHVNTFDHVIDCLVDICDHDPIQAEQCAVITHYKGRCSIKHGEYEELKRFHGALGERGLTVEIQ